MAYAGVDWRNDPDHTSPINAANLEIMDNGIKDNDSKITTINDALYNSNSYADETSDWQRLAIYATTSPSGLIYVDSSTTRISFNNRIAVDAGERISFNCPSGIKYRVIFFQSSGPLVATNTYTQVDAGLDDYSTWHTDSRTLTVPNGASAFAVTLAYLNDSNITTSDLPSDFTIISFSFYTAINNLKNQVENLNDDVNTKVSASEMEKAFVENIGGYQKEITPNTWLQGLLPVAGTAGPYTPLSTSTTRCGEDNPHTIDNSNNDKKIKVEIPNTKKCRVKFWASNNSYISTSSDSTWTTGSFLFNVPSNAAFYRLAVAYTNDSTITPSDCSDVKLFEMIGESSVTENEYKGKKISILGDSISTFAGTNPSTDPDGHTIADGTYTYAGNHCRYPNTYLSSVSDTYWMKLIEALELELDVNDSWAGSRVSWNGQEGSDYGANIYIASPTRIGHLNGNGTPDIILVNAGTNDIGLNVSVGTFNTENPKNYTDEQIAALPVATFADAYRALLIRLQKAYPLAIIVVMLPNYTTSYYNPENADKYLEVIKEACDYFGVPWIDIRTTGFNMWNTDSYTGDGIHPNVSGMNLLFKKVLKGFKYQV